MSLYLNPLFYHPLGSTNSFITIYEETDDSFTGIPDAYISVIVTDSLATIFLL